MRNGLYSTHARALDGVNWLGGGVAILIDGVIVGGGPYTYYTGSYSFKEGRLKAEVILNTHTPPPVDSLFYGASNVGVGVTGTYEADEAELFLTALLRKRSISFNMSLKKLADV